jgi:DNA-binding XRE family transcriptional regulator
LHKKEGVFMGVFYNNYVCQCNNVGKSPSAVALEIGLSKTAVNGWKTGRSTPTDATAQRIADYFGIAVEDLYKEQKENPAVISDNEVDEVTMELLEIINNGSDADRQDMLDMLRIFNKRREKG